jgi:hypothetical protein
MRIGRGGDEVTGAACAAMRLRRRFAQHPGHKREQRPTSLADVGGDRIWAAAARSEQRGRNGPDGGRGSRWKMNAAEDELREEQGEMGSQGTAVRQAEPALGRSRGRSGTGAVQRREAKCCRSSQQRRSRKAARETAGLGLVLVLVLVSGRFWPSCPRR